MQPIMTMHDHNVKTLKSKIEHIRTRQSELTQLQSDLEVNEEEIKNSKETVIRQIRAFVEQTVHRIDKERRDKLRQVEGNKQKLSKEIKKIENTIGEVEKGLDQLAPFDLLQKKRELDAMLFQLTITPMSSFVSSPVSTEYYSDIAPRYSSGMTSPIIIYNFRAGKVSPTGLPCGFKNCKNRAATLMFRASGTAELFFAYP